MLISGGKVIAIDKVKHDSTLTGDGRFNPLGVNPSNLINAGDWISITGEYKNNNFTAAKEAGTIEFSNGAELKKNSVYKVTTNISFKTKSATPNWYEVNFKVGDIIHDFTIDGTNPGKQTYSFSQIENCTASKTLSLRANFDTDLGSAFVRQTIHNIVSMGSSGGESSGGIIYSAGQYIKIDGNVISVTGLQPVGNYITVESANSSYYPLNENPSGYLTELPEGTMNTSYLEFTSADKISAYDGSAFIGCSCMPPEPPTPPEPYINTLNMVLSQNSAASSFNLLVENGSSGLDPSTYNTLEMTISDENNLSSSYDLMCVTGTTAHIGNKDYDTLEMILSEDGVSSTYNVLVDNEE